LSKLLNLRKIYSCLALFALGGGGCSSHARSGQGLAGALADRAPPPVAQVAASPLRRLTEEQYRNTLHDLLGIADLATDLPIDEGSGGFYGNAIAPVSELFLEKYGRAAELAARQAVTHLGALLPCDPVAVGEDACARTFVERFGRRAFRRPLAQDEIAAYAALFAAGRAGADFAGGIRLVVQGMLESPHFLYLFESPPPAGAGAVVAAVPPYALAARLSYYLWSTMPDEALLAAAAAGTLSTRAGLGAEIARMLADPRFANTVRSFHLQWLDVSEIGGQEKRKKIYPLWSDDLRAAMREETVRFVDQVVRSGDGRLETLLTAPFSIVNAPLAELYGLAGAKGDAGTWQQVTLDTRQRAGVLTHPSVMTVHAHWDKPSLVLRGKLVREKLLCTVLPPPPPDVNNTLPQADPKVSMRERFEDHRSDVSCARCHRLIDPLGAPFEHYDGIGAWRSDDGPRPVDTEGELRGAGKTDGTVKDAIELVTRLATSDEVRACIARQWFRFALGRDEAPEDAASIAAATQVFRESGYRIPALVAAVAGSDAFRYEVVRP
jgi:hypothetical protein